VNIFIFTYFTCGQRQRSGDQGVSVEALYERARNGEKTAREELFSYLSVRFKSLAHLKIWNTQDADEVVQEALLTISGEFKKMDIHTSFLAWAYRVFDYKILTYIEAKRRRQGHGETVELSEDALESGSEEVDFDLKDRLLDCFRKVRAASTQYARIVALHYQGYKTEEICDRLSVKPPHMHVIMYRARGMLKNCLEKGKV
jgi:RNA polymerase sigma factor (sigma-70 family)